MSSAITLVNGSLPPQNVALSSTVNLALQDSAGVSTWSLTCTSTDELNTTAAVNATLSINMVNFTATFTMPSTSTGSAVQFTSTVNGDKTTTVTFGVFVLGPMGNRLLFPGETNESSAQYGVVKDLNTVGRVTPGSAPVATNSTPGTIILAHDLSGTYDLPVVAKVNGVSVTTSPTANTVLTATSATTSVWSPIFDAQVSSSAAIAGTKINPAFGNQTLSLSSGGVLSMPTGTVATFNGVNNTTINGLSLSSGSSSTLGTSATLTVLGSITYNNGATLTANSGASTVFNGKFSVITRAETANYTCDTTASDYVILADSSGGSAVTITLPPPTAGRRIIVTDAGGAANLHTIQINPNSTEKISGSSVRQITSAYGSAELVANGTNWFITSAWGTVA